MWNTFVKRTYLDHASATPLLPEALSAMNDAEARFANPGSIHSEGVAARGLLEDSREKIAGKFGVKPRQVVFTSGLTESNNLAILGFARRLELSGARFADTHWITTSIEHASVLEAFVEIERKGGIVTRVGPDERGIIAPEALRAALRPETVLVSVGWGNNEIGVVQDISALTRVVRAALPKKPVIFHSDAGQCPLYYSPQMHTLGVDVLSVGAGKLYGPRSSGALCVLDPSRFAPMVLGGEHEGGLRAGTEDVVPAVGFARALEVIARERSSEAARLGKLRDELALALAAKIPGIVFNGDRKHTLPHMLNVSIPDINSEYLVLALDAKGFALSTRSACESSAARSHVVHALGGAPPTAQWRSSNTLRISLGRDTSDSDVKRFAGTLVALLKDLPRA
ncbi:MAG: cysteine desulfurase [Patescibacteria group bacterium]|nr:cysteine desulfurase [Patescibacteria group bacterium]